MITIDGIQIEPSGQNNVLECALEAGIYIPHLCYHPDLPPGASCRMCVVEVEGEDQPVTACTLEPKDGLVVRTKSSQLDKLRALALELLLAGHPEDCTTCPKYGNCELQTLIQYIGPSTGRMRLRSKGFSKESRNPLLEHEMNRCVLCGRCVRACNDLRAVKVLQYQKKGMEFYIGAIEKKLLGDAGCRFCGACAEVCPTGAIHDKLRAAAQHWGRQETIVPCRATCPANIDIPRYIRLVREGQYDEAAAVIREKVPFPKILGYICNHECEGSCKRGDVNAPMSIKNLKRIAAEEDSGSVWQPRSKQLPDTDKRVCVIGAGPAGLTAAYYLRKQGHAVTVKEALPEAGGMLRYGIPAYRLPDQVIQEEISVIIGAGVTLETGVYVERPGELLGQYDAVLLALGTHRGVRLPLPGAELPGVLLNADFLRAVRMGQPPEVGKRVVVLGGGNVAFDCARTARRLGAQEVHLACLEARPAMLADPEEIAQAEEEGIIVHPSSSFEAIIGENHVTGMDLMMVESFTLVKGSAQVIKRPGSAWHIDADTVIFAVGQRTLLPPESGLPLLSPGRIAMAGSSPATQAPGIFATGDMVYGTKSVIKAISSGREAAQAIDQFLGGSGDISEELAPREVLSGRLGHEDGFAALPREQAPVSAVGDRTAGFGPVNPGLCREAACREAGRCLQCDLRLDLHRPRLWNDYNQA